MPDGLRRAAVGLLLAVAVVSVLAVIVAGSLLAYGLHHSDTIFTGASSAGVQLGGKTVDEAEAALQQRFQDFATQPIELAAGDVTLQPTPHDLGVRIDAEATAEKAHRFGRSSSLWVETRHWLDALSGGHNVEPIITVDAATFAAYLDAHAEQIVSAPREPAFALSSEGVAVTPGVPGTALDVQATFARFRERMLAMSNEPIEIVTVQVPPETDDDELSSVLERVQTLAGDPLELHLDGAIWKIGEPDLLAMLRAERSDDGIVVALDQQALRRSIRALEPQVFRPGTDASIHNDNGTFTTVPAAPGRKLDIDASLAQAMEALERGDNRVELATTAVQANITDAVVAEAKAAAETLTAKPLTLSWDAGSSAIDPGQLRTAVRFDVNAARNPQINISLDQSVMTQFLEPIAQQVTVDPVNAEFRWINGQVTVQSGERPGRELDVAATVGRMEEAIWSGSDTAAVVTRDLQPEITAAMAGSIQFPDKLAEGVTEYGTSAPNRLHNVELAASRVNGAMVPPGGIFSFNHAVGEVTFNSGYKTGYGIIATNGSISTIPSVGGGICQVATTVFHAAFRAGMPIVERSWHLYWIPRYGQPPSGMKGLDATVDPDYNLDFKFRNATDNWIAVVSHYDGANLRFEIWGTNPGWEVVIDQPVITNVQPASHLMFYEETSELPAGTRVFVEHAEDGFDAQIHRVVRKDGQVIDEMTLVSNYAPARNLTLIGTG